MAHMIWSYNLAKIILSDILGWCICPYHIVYCIIEYFLFDILWFSLNWMFDSLVIIFGISEVSDLIWNWSLNPKTSKRQTNPNNPKIYRFLPVFLNILLILSYNLIILILIWSRLKNGFSGKNRWTYVENKFCPG